MRQCIAAFKGLPCSGSIPKDAPDPACDKVIVGLVAAGGACRSGQCKEGLYCAHSAEKPGCDGVCVTRLGKDKPCGEPADYCPKELPNCEVYSGVCAAGLSCEGKDKQTCQAEKNESRAKEGQDCKDAKCEDGLYCNHDDKSSAETCKALPKAGAACTDNGNKCAAGLWCDTEDSNKCMAAIDEGAACPLKAALSGGIGTGSVCKQGLTCSIVGLVLDLAGPKPESKCLKVVELGGACTDMSVCKGIDTWCKPAADKKTGTCALLPAAGQPCMQTLPLQCLPPAQCNMPDGEKADFTKGTCSGDLAEGEACKLGGPVRCKASLMCVAGKCAQPPKAGEACVDMGGDKACAPYSSDSGLQCKDGKCVDVCVEK